MNSNFKSQKVSVLVPCYNVEKTLERCLDSIESQTHKNIEIIAVNDGSTDGTIALLKSRFVKSPCDFKLIEKENTGYGDSMNKAIDAATGDWIAIVEPDDWIEPDMYESMLSFADDIMERSNSEYRPDIIKTPYWREVNGEQIRCGYKGLIKPSSQPFMVQDAPEIIGGHPSIWSALYNRDYLINHDIRFKPIPGAGWSDNPFMISAMCRNFPIVYMDREFYHYTDTADDDYRKVMINDPSMPFDRWNDMMDVMESIDGVSNGNGGNDDIVISSNNESIYREIVRRGFTYLALAEENKPNDGSADKVIAHESIKMFKRMSKRIVETDVKLSSTQKNRFAAALGIDLKHSRCEKISHTGYLIKRGIASLLANGMSQTIRQIAKAKR